MKEPDLEANHQMDFSLKSTADIIKKEYVEHKKGGPYTKLEQEKRREVVFDFHFEKNYPAVKIAEMLDVNRNTVNDDIKYRYSQISEELDAHTVETWTIKQYQRMEAQRKRLLAELENQTQPHGVIAIEKMIFELDKMLNDFIYPIIAGRKSNKTKYNITDDIVKEIVEFLIQNEDVYKLTRYKAEELEFDIIKMKKCDVWFARQVIEKMNDLGYSLCRADGALHTTGDLLTFAVIRGIISEGKHKQLNKKLKQEMKEFGEYVEEIYDDKTKKNNSSVKST